MAEQQLPVRSRFLATYTCSCCGVPYASFYEHSIPPSIDPEATWRPTGDDSDAGSPDILYGCLKRVFLPCDSTEWKGTKNPDTLRRYNPKSQITNFLISRTPKGVLYPRMSTLVVAVDGACRGNGTSSAQAGIGVFFGEGSRYNCATRLQETYTQTNNVAELMSSLMALHRMESEILAHHTPKIKQVVLVTDSEYVAKAMSEHIWKWLENGFTTTKGTKVKNAGLLLGLHRMIERFKEELGVDVRFWRVDRGFNQQADELANMALNSDGQLDVEFDECLQCAHCIPVPNICYHG